MEPTREQIDRAATVLAHHDTNSSLEQGIKAVEAQLDQVREQRERLHRAEGAELDGFSLEHALDGGGRKILARMVLSDASSPVSLAIRS